MDQFKLFLWIFLRRDLDELLGDAQHDRPKARVDNNAGSDNDNLYAIIKGMQR